MTEEQQRLVGREFVHFKGGHYRLEGFAKDSETLEEMVVYRALNTVPRSPFPAYGCVQQRCSSRPSNAMDSA